MTEPWPLFGRHTHRPGPRAGRMAFGLLVLVAMAVGCASTPSPSVQPSASTVAVPGWFAFTVASGDLWAVRGDGLDRHQLTTSADAVDISPAWAPDASRLAYRHAVGTSGGTPGSDEIRIVNADGSGGRDLVSGSFPDWSPDGAWIAFRGTTGLDLALIRPDGTDLRSLGVPNAECPVWSPDSLRILYCQNADASGVVSDNWEIWVMDRDGSHRRQLTDNPARDYPIAWSADGSRIVFYSQRDGPGASYLMDADGTNVSRLIDASDLSTVGAWLPDGRFVISSAGEEVPVWYLLDPDGGRQPLPQLDGAFDPIGWVAAR